MSWLVVVLIVIAVIIAPFLYLAWYMHWEGRQTTGTAYYGRPLAERRALKRRVRSYSMPARSIVRLLARANPIRTMPAFEHEGVFGPPKVSSPEVFARAKAYTPGPEDVFVATQMRCGTTWMQEIVYEIVMRGRGDHSDHGHGHMGAMSPWIDAVNGVLMADAPLVGERPTRIVKTHLPAALCPYSPQAKYIYVTRHPVGCFASIVDYNRALLGPLTPSMDVLVDWFCSDRMYWLPWPKHVTGYWEWSENRDNVLFLHYEEMKSDFAAARDRVAGFLGYTLTSEERKSVDEKCSFKYMSDHEEWFEMSPPTMFSVVEGTFLPSGKASRHGDVTDAIRQRILDYCEHALRGHTYPASRFYPDLGAPAAAGRSGL